jgi:uncharacterized protein (TIGR03435 family)
MATFASGLQGNVDRPVVDRTGLSGRFDIALDWAPDEFQPPDIGLNSAAGADASFPNLYTALRDQLGWKLESRKAPVEILVIDHIERPSEN